MEKPLSNDSTDRGSAYLGSSALFPMTVLTEGQHTWVLPPSFQWQYWQRVSTLGFFSPLSNDSTDRGSAHLGSSALFPMTVLTEGQHTWVLQPSFQWQYWQRVSTLGFFSPLSNDSTDRGSADLDTSALFPVTVLTKGQQTWVLQPSFQWQYWQRVSRLGFFSPLSNDSTDRGSAHLGSSALFPMTVLTEGQQTLVLQPSFHWQYWQRVSTLGFFSPLSTDSTDRGSAHLGSFHWKYW